jgi:hypothetical protein
MVRCKICDEEAYTSCDFCGGQTKRTHLCTNHIIQMINNKGDSSIACVKCAEIKTKKGMWNRKV